MSRFRHSLPICFVILAVTIMSVSVWAKNDTSDTITTKIKLDAATTVGTTQLAPGEYKVTADGSKAKFELKGKVVAEVPCTLKDANSKLNQSSFVLDNNKIVEIQIAGKSKSIEF